MKKIWKEIMYRIKTTPIKKIKKSAIIQFDKKYALCLKDKYDENSWTIIFYDKNEEPIYVNIPTYRVKKIKSYDK